MPDEKAKSYLKKAGTMMLVFYVSLIFVILAIMCVTSFYIYNLGKPRSAYLDRAELIVGRYVRTVEDLNALEADTEVSFQKYYEGIEDALYDLKEAKKDTELLSDPVSPEFSVLDHNIKTALDSGIGCLSAELKYLNEVSPVANELKALFEYRRRAENAKSDYEKRVYEQRYNALRARLGPRFASAEKLTADVRRRNAEFARVSEALAPEIEHHFGMECKPYTPKRIRTYVGE